MNKLYIYVYILSIYSMVYFVKRNRTVWDAPLSFDKAEATREEIPGRSFLIIITLRALPLDISALHIIAFKSKHSFVKDVIRHSIGRCSNPRIDRGNANGGDIGGDRIPGNRRI